MILYKKNNLLKENNLSKKAYLFIANEYHLHTMQPFAVKIKREFFYEDAHKTLGGDWGLHHGPY